jgi:RNA-directed DNA polymerase
MDNNTATKLTLIANKARECKTTKFNALIHHINHEHLLACFKDLKRGKAGGIDTRTKESYSEEEITDILRQTIADMKSKVYRPQPVKRVFIDKAGTTKKRPLGLPTVIDKTVQQACKNILEAIYEADFLDCSYGYRPNKDAHGALKELNHMVMQKKINWVLDADIKGFFDNIDHNWMMEMLSERISDSNLKSLIYKFLQSGVMEDHIYSKTEQGIPQGGIVSPVLANIYLHYVLDLWFEKVVKKELKGDIQLIRYADDFVIGLQHKDQAEKLYKMLKERLAKFGLTLAEDKTHIVEFGRFAQENHRNSGHGKPKTFTFLGLTHFCTTTRDGRFKLGVKTSGKKMNGSLTNMNAWLKKMRNRMKQEQLWKLLGAKLQGHYNYYGVSGNFDSIQTFYRQTIFLTYKWLNRRSQKKSFTWPSFWLYLESYPLPRPALTFQIYNTW